MKTLIALALSTFLLLIACATTGTSSTDTEPDGNKKEIGSSGPSSKSGTLRLATSTPTYDQMMASIVRADIESAGLDSENVYHVTVEDYEVYETVQECGGLKALWDTLVEGTINAKYLSDDLTHIVVPPEDGRNKTQVTGRLGLVIFEGWGDLDDVSEPVTFWRIEVDLTYGRGERDRDTKVVKANGKLHSDCSIEVLQERWLIGDD